jgi:EF-hand domain pair
MAYAGCMTYHEFHQLMLPSVSQRVTNDLDTVVSAFQYNRELPPFQKLARRIIAENAPPNRELEVINKAFYKLDKDGSGTLTREELAKGLQQAGYVVSNDDLERVFRQLDTDGTGVVRYLEFVAGAISHNILVSDTLLRWVFDFVDDDDSNSITKANLQVGFLTDAHSSFISSVVANRGDVDKVR